MNKEIECWREVTRKFAALPPPSPKSIFDIVGKRHSENGISNVLAFFLNPNGEHGLGDLFLSALLDVSAEGLADGTQVPPVRDVLVEREVQENGLRIDIVVKTDRHVIGIENKIHAALNNNLRGYGQNIEMWAKDQGKAAKKIVLSVRDEGGCSESGFINVTYGKYWNEIRKRMGLHVTTASQKWMLYLVDFLDALDKEGGNGLDEQDRFIAENFEEILAMTKKMEEFCRNCKPVVETIEQKLRESDRKPHRDLFLNPRNWKNICLVNEFQFEGKIISFDFKITENGWQLQLFGRPQPEYSGSQEYLEKLFRYRPLSEEKEIIEAKIREGNPRYILKRYGGFQPNPDTVVRHLLGWFDKLVQSHKTCEGEKETANKSI